MSGGGGPVGRDDDVRAELVAVEGEWAQAVMSNDAGRIAGFMATDWVLVSDSGVLFAERFLGCYPVREAGSLADDCGRGEPGPRLR